MLPQDLAFGLNEQNKRNIKGEQANYQLQLHNTLKNAYKKLVDRKKEEQNKYKIYYDRNHKAGGI